MRWARRGTVTRGYCGAPCRTSSASASTPSSCARAWGASRPTCGGSCPSCSTSARPCTSTCSSARRARGAGGRGLAGGPRRARHAPAARVPGGKAITELTVLGALASRRRADVLHSVAMTGPLRTRATHVVTVGDLIWMDPPDPADPRHEHALARDRPAGGAARRPRALVQRGVEGADRRAPARARGEGSTSCCSGTARRPARPDAGGRAARAPGPRRRPVVLTVSAKRRHKT